MRPMAFLGAVCAMLLLGCGADRSFSSGIDGGRQIDDLSDEDVQQVCRDLEAYLNDYALEPEEVHRAMCTVMGLVAADSGLPGVSCEQMVADCPLDPVGPWSLDCEDWTADAVAGCDASVDELEACVSETGDGLRASLSEVQCSLDTGDAQAEIERMADSFDSASCEGVQEGCELLDLDFDLGGFNGFE